MLRLASLFRAAVPGAAVMGLAAMVVEEKVLFCLSDMSRMSEVMRGAIVM